MAGNTLRSTRSAISTKSLTRRQPATIVFGRTSSGHTIGLKIGSPDLYLDGIHYVMSFPIEGGDHDWLVSRMDVIKLFEPVLRPTEISGRHAIRGVVIDAGHGGTDNGATSRLGNEKTYTLDTAYKLDAILRGAGLKTVFTRRTDVFVDLYERAHIASLYPDYCFVSIHFNSAMEEARGLETYCLSPRGAASTSSAYLTRGDIQKLRAMTTTRRTSCSRRWSIRKSSSSIRRCDGGSRREARAVCRDQGKYDPGDFGRRWFCFQSHGGGAGEPERLSAGVAQAIARGVVRFINAMGDRHMALPGTGLDFGTPPVAKPVQPVAPTGLAHDPLNPAVKLGVSSSTTNAASVTPSVSSHKKKKKSAGVAGQTPATNSITAPVAPASTNTVPTPAEPAPTHETAAKPEEKPEAPATNSSNALNLAEPAAPAPSPGAEKAPAEPDEPPTVNIYPTTPAAGNTPPSTNAPAAHEP